MQKYIQQQILAVYKFVYFAEEEKKSIYYGTEIVERQILLPHMGTK